MIGLSDMRGISAPIHVAYGGNALEMMPGIKGDGPIKSGVQASIPLDPQPNNNTMTFDLQINGSRQIQFTPVGRTTTVEMQSPRPDPGFVGDFLPAALIFRAHLFQPGLYTLFSSSDYVDYRLRPKHSKERSDYSNCRQHIDAAIWILICAAASGRLCLKKAYVRSSRVGRFTNRPYDAE